jgi:hypothetical protein
MGLLKFGCECEQEREIRNVAIAKGSLLIEVAGGLGSLVNQFQFRFCI